MSRESTTDAGRRRVVVLREQEFEEFGHFCQSTTSFESTFFFEFSILENQKKGGNVWGKLKFPTWHVFISQRIRRRRIIRGVPKEMDEIDAGG